MKRTLYMEVPDVKLGHVLAELRRGIPEQNITVTWDDHHRVWIVEVND
jgi:hypothetical protein